MGDKLRDLTPVQISFSAGEQPTASKLTAWAQQIERGFLILEKAIGDLYSDSHPLFQSGNTPVGGWAYDRTGTNLGSEQRHLQILSLARLIGPASVLNPRALSNQTVTITENVEGGQNGFTTRYRPITNVSLVATLTGVFTTLKSTANDVVSFGDYHVDATNGQLTYIGAQQADVGTVTYDVDISAAFGSDTYEDATFNVIPDPNQATKCNVTGPSSGRYTIVLPTATDGQTNWDELTTTLELEEDPNYLSQLTLPVSWSTEFVSGDEIPEGLIMLWDGDAATFIAGQTFYYVSQTQIEVDDSTTLEVSSDRYTIVVPGVDITRTIDALRTKFYKHTHTGDDGSQAIDHADIVGKARGFISIDEAGGGSDKVIGWTRRFGSIPYNDHPQYLHRQGADSSALKNALFGSLLIAPEKYDDGTNGWASSEKLLFDGTEGQTGFNTYRIYFGDVDDDAPWIRGEYHGSSDGAALVLSAAGGSSYSESSSDGVIVQSGRRIVLDNTGQSTYSIFLTSGLDVNLNAADDITLTATDLISLSAGNDISITATDDITVTAGGDFNLSADTVDLTATAGALNLSATGSITITADSDTNGDTNLTLTTTGDIFLNAGEGAGGDFVQIPLSSVKMANGFGIGTAGATVLTNGMVFRSTSATSSVAPVIFGVVEPDFVMGGLAIASSVTGTGSEDYICGMENKATVGGAIRKNILRMVHHGSDADVDADDFFIRGHVDAGATLEWAIDGEGVYSDTFTGQHWVVYHTAPGTRMVEEIDPGMIVESTGEVWNKSAAHIDEALPIVHITSERGSKKVYGVMSIVRNNDIMNRRWQAFDKPFHPDSMAPCEATTMEVVSSGEMIMLINTPDSSIEPGQIVKLTEHAFACFTVVEVTEDHIELANKKEFPIPAGTFTLQRVNEDTFEPATIAFNPTSRYFKAQVNSVGEGQIWITDLNGEIANGDYIQSSEIPGFGCKQDDDILRSSTVAKCVEAVDWTSVEETVTHEGTPYKKALVACTYHCG